MNIISERMLKTLLVKLKTLLFDDRIILFSHFNVEKIEFFTFFTGFSTCVSFFLYTSVIRVNA